MINQEHKHVYENEMKFGYQTGLLPMYSVPISRKRSHETSSFQNPNEFNNENGTFTLLGQDISMQICQQQLEIDEFIAHHTEKVKYEIEATRRTNSMRLIAAAEDQITKKLRLKENEIVKINKLNYSLEEKVKTLNVENQIWQQMAETNEATANVLRRNLQRILIEIQQQQNQNDDVESCCGSNTGKDHYRRTLAEVTNDANSYSSGSRLNRWCRNCGKEESCVLLLPCRHLCICTVCESSINICPICKSSKNATLHVNMC